MSPQARPCPSTAAPGAVIVKSPTPDDPALRAIAAAANAIRSGRFAVTVPTTGWLDTFLHRWCTKRWGNSVVVIRAIISPRSTPPRPRAENARSSSSAATGGNDVPDDAPAAAPHDALDRLRSLALTLDSDQLRWCADRWHEERRNAATTIRAQQGALDSMARDVNMAD